MSGIGTDAAVPATIHDKEYPKHLREVTEHRQKTGIAAPGEDPEVLLFVPEYNHARKLEMLAADLMRRGHKAARVEKILGGNFARLFGEMLG